MTWVPLVICCYTFVLNMVRHNFLLFCILYLYCYLRGFPYLRSSYFWFKNTPTSLWLNRDKTKGQFGKNTTLTPIKTLPKKYDHSAVDFQISLSTYKLDSQNKNCIYKIKSQNFFFWLQNRTTKKKASLHVHVYDKSYFDLEKNLIFNLLLSMSWYKFDDKLFYLF